MTFPALRTYTNGDTANPVSGDNFNTMVQTGLTAAQLRNFTGLTGSVVYLSGLSSMGDGGQGNFVYNAALSHPTDDGANIIVPPGAASGAWVRQSALYTTAAPSIIFTPVTNPIVTYGSGVIQVSSGQANAREFAFAVDFNVSTGSGAAGAARDKVAIYGGVMQNAGAGDVWGLNTVTTMAAGSGTSSAQGYECDFNNLNADRGNAAAGAGFAAPIAVGLSVTGASSYKSTAALLVSGPGSAIWNRGIAFANASVSQATFQDFTNSTTVFDIYGVHTYGLDLSQAAITSPIRMANGGIVTARNAANNADLPIWQLDSSNNLRIGGVGVTSILTYGGSFLPSLDNTYTLGANGARWAAVWAANGTIQTSDVTFKLDIAPLVATRDIVMAIEPVTYRWKDGGSDVVETTEEQDVQALETHEWYEDAVEMRDGVATLTSVRRTVQREAWDEVPVFNADGSEAWIDIPAKDAVYGPNGRVMRQAQPATRVRRTHRVARMEKRQVPVVKAVQREGKRTHWGFIAQRVKEAFDTQALDFAGYVKGADGVEGLRMDQLLPVLWRDHQDLVREVVALRAEIATLKETSK